MTAPTPTSFQPAPNWPFAGQPPVPDWLNVPLDSATLVTLQDAWTRHAARLRRIEQRCITWGAPGSLGWLAMAVWLTDGHVEAVWPWVGLVGLVIGYLVLSVRLLPPQLLAQHVLDQLRPLDGADQAAMDWLLAHRPQAVRLRDHLADRPRPGRQGELYALKELPEDCSTASTSKDPASRLPGSTERA